MRLRTVGLVVGLLLLAVYASLAVYVYLAKTYPERYGRSMSGYAWILGPPADSLRDAARTHMQRGVEYLNDRSRPAPERLRLYREELRTAERLLVRSLRAQPAQARALAELAAVRWELDPPTTPEAVERHLEMIRLASSMAPTVPRVQQDLGELLLRMARRDEALKYFARTVRLDPRTSADVVAILLDNLFQPGEILQAMPREPELLAALQHAFFDRGLETEYLDALEPVLDDPRSEPTRAFLMAYGNACLRARQFDRLRTRMEAVGPYPDGDVEASRWQQISRAALAEGDHDRALEAARRAIELDAEAPYLHVYLGDVALDGGDHDLALASYRDALAILARTKAAPGVRAGVYAKIGRAHEAAGHPDRAYDDYKRALKLDPEQAWAKRRVDEMEGKAGL